MNGIEDRDTEDDEFGTFDGKEHHLVLAEARHLESITNHCNGKNDWKTKDKMCTCQTVNKMKTMSVALVLCLNIPVDPPDVVKLQPCARLEAWVDPLSMPPTKANEVIGTSLQKAYERGQPRARYKRSLDPTMDDIKKLCTSLRRNAKEERVLFHYNGHGVPRPTDNGELWVFNSNYTQYIPLSIYDLQQWMGTPSIYVYDCSHAGKIVKLFKTFSKGLEENKCLQLAACGEKELLPMNPDLPADLFTSCLTTPLQIALRYYVLQNKKRIPEITLDMLDKIPGQLNDRRSMLGELIWIFTAITDTIAWNTLPRDLFQKLFRQDLLVASLFRNFLLAERIMRSYDCYPVSSPALPSTYKNHMWNAWDLVLKLALSQLPRILSLNEPGSGYVSSPFFEEHLTAFQVWLSLGSMRRTPPEQLPIVLQVLLSQVYRPRALELLGTFLGLGPSAVNLVLEVGIFPYILKLLQSPARELRPLLTILWSKILAVDPCKIDLVRESGNKYFINVLKETSMPAEHRTMAAFVICVLVSDCPEGQTAALKGSILHSCLELILDEHAPMRQWATICAAKTWDRFPKARWEGTRDNAAEKLSDLLNDPVPEVRASAVYALGTFIRSLPMGDASEQGRSINHNIGVILRDKLTEEASSLVKQEMVVALQYLILLYESSFCSVAKQSIPQPLGRKSPGDNKYTNMSPSPSLGRLNSDPTRGGLNDSQVYGTSPISSGVEASLLLLSPAGIRRTGSLKSLSSTSSSGSLFSSSLSHGRMYLKVWESFARLKDDPHPQVAMAAGKVVNHIVNKILNNSEDAICFKSDLSTSTLQSKSTGSIEESPPKDVAGLNHSRRSSINQNSIHEENDEFVTPLVRSSFFEWSSKAFMKSGDSLDTERNDGPNILIYDRCSRLPPEEERRVIGSSQKLEQQVFLHRNPGSPEALAFHPYETHLVVADKCHLTVYDVENRSSINYWNNGNAGPSRISSLAIINAGSPFTSLATGCDDGSLRIWKEHFKSYDAPNLQLKASIEPEERRPAVMVAAFQALEETAASKRVSGLLMSWEQKSSTLVVGGDSDKIRIWDLASERKIRDLSTNGLTTTALHSLDDRGSWIVAGFADGYVRLLDRKLPKPIVRQWRDFTSRVITTQLFSSSSLSAQFISATDCGEVCLYDLRRTGSVQVCSPEGHRGIIGSPSAFEPHRTTAMAYHPKSHLIALGSPNQISINHRKGSKINTIRSGPVKCLCFHPSRVLLASGTTEGFITIYGYSKR